MQNLELQTTREMRNRGVRSDSLFSNVTQDVGKLVGDAQCEGAVVDTLGSGLGLRVDAHDWYAHQAYRARDVVAVQVKLVEICVPGFHQVHSHPVDHVSEGLLTQTEILTPNKFYFESFDASHRIEFDSVMPKWLSKMRTIPEYRQEI